MKKIISLLLALLFCFAVLSGCAVDNKEEPDESLAAADELPIVSEDRIHTDYLGVYLTFDTSSSDGITVVWNNDAENDVVYGEYYYVEKYDDTGEWRSVLRDEFAAAAIGLILSANSAQVKTYSMAPFDISGEGRYRLRCEFYPGDGKTCNTWVEFDVGIEHSGYETTVKILQYTWDGWGVSSKTIAACDEAYAIIDALEKMSETGKKVAKISNKTVSEGGGQLPVERGTMWLELGSEIYRIDREPNRISRVDGHLGRGYVLDAPEDFFTLVYNAWQYYPYDYYTGSYNNSTGEIILNNVYSASSTVSVNIKKLDVVNEDRPVNKITLELESTIDQMTYITLLCQRSDDDLAAGDYKNIELKAGKIETLELSFGGWDNSYFWIYIIIDNTKICLRIEP